MKTKTEVLAKLEANPDSMTDVELLACVLSKNPGQEHLKAASKLLVGGRVSEQSTTYSTRVKAATLLGKRLAAKPVGAFLKPRDVWEALP